MYNSGMLGDLAKALDKFLKGLGRLQPPGQKRTEIARKLRALYVDLEEVVEAGVAIQKSLGEGKLELQKQRGIRWLSEDDGGEGSHIVPAGQLQEALLRKQRAIDKILGDLKDEEIQAIIHIQVPEIKDLQFVLGHRGIAIAFMLSQLTSDPAGTEKLTKKSEYGGRVIDKKALEKKYGPSGFYWENLESLKSERSAWVSRNHDDQYPSRIFATAEEVRQYGEIIRALKDLQERFRQFLIKEFTVEELL
jgi:hypothetical protein